jgi:chromosome segregation ATPase
MNPSHSIRCSVLAVSALMATVATAPLDAVAQSASAGVAGQGSGPIMTRDELRSCLRQQDEIKRRRDALEAEREALESEKAAIQAENESLQGGRGDIRDANAKVQAVNARRTELATRIDDWNRRWAEFETSNRTGPIAERARKKLLDEQRALAKEDAAIDAEQAGVQAPTADAAAFNARATALAERTRNWNARNAKAADESVKLTDERELWTIECGNRRFLTDDEKAIRSGQ